MWSDAGCTSLALSLAGLPVCGCALMVGAHPDDEDNALLALLAKGMFLESYYLVATYGEGGQNECGHELYEALGVLRMQELAAARRIDGARQLYMGARDFGYSKSARDTFARWDRDALLAFTVAVVRERRPDIVLTYHDTVSGHGHHQAVGWLIQEAVEFAADSSRFPEQLEAGLSPWQVKRFCVYERRTDDADSLHRRTVVANVGAYSPLLGMSYYQLGQASRSMHKCQGMGGEGERGDKIRRYRVLLDQVGHAQGEAGLLDSMDLSLPGLIAGLAGHEDVLTRLAHLAIEAQNCAEVAAAAFHPTRPQSADGCSAMAAHLSRGLDAVREMGRIAREASCDGGLDRASAATLACRMESKAADWAAALTALAAVELVVRTEPSPALVVPGGQVNLKVQLWRRGLLPVSAGACRLKAPAGWNCEAAAPAPTPASANVSQNSFAEWHFTVSPPLSATATPALGPDPVSVECDWSVDCGPLSDVAHITTSAPGGVTVVPPVEVELEPQSLMVAASRLPMVQVYSVSLKNNIQGATGGHVRLSLPEALASSAGDALHFSMAATGEQVTLRAPVTVAAACGAPGSLVHTIEAEAYVNVDGSVLPCNQSCQLISYPHIQARLLPRQAAARLCVVDVTMPDGLMVGYVDTGVDDLAGYMEQLGASVTRLDDDDLRLSDLGQFNTVVLGVRAYHLRPALAGVNPRLLEYVRRGGTLVVQYHKTTEWDPSYAPYPLHVGDSRVSDETAPIELLDPTHPVMTGPNRIESRDWDGWVQERGLYFARDWSRHYQPLVRCADPGEPPLGGAWLVAHYGAGAYIYNALSLYRQIESLVPGGARVWCNMISYRQKG